MNQERPAGIVRGNFEPLSPKITLKDGESSGSARARLMAAVQRGDREAYAELLNDIGPSVMTFVRRRIRDAGDAQDLYQDVFVAMHRARHTYDPARPLEPWLFAIARRVVNDHERRRVARQAREVLVDVPPEEAIEPDAQLKTRLEQALGRLSAVQRQALDLVKVAGLPSEQAARTAGTTVGALRVRVHRACSLLRQLL